MNYGLGRQGTSSLVLVYMSTLAPAIKQLYASFPHTKHVSLSPREESHVLSDQCFQLKSRIFG